MKGNDLFNTNNLSVPRTANELFEALDRQTEILDRIEQIRLIKQEIQFSKVIKPFIFSK